MTQKEKARAYDEALDRCKEWVSGTWGHSVDDTPKDVAEFIFPQLAESEDEKMVVKIARTLSFAAAHNLITDYDELIAMQNWLEKQKKSGIQWLKSDNVKNPDKPYVDKAGMFYTTDGRMCYASEIEKQKEQKSEKYGDDVVEEAEEYTSKVDCGEYGVEVTEAYIAGVLSERNRGTEWSEEDERIRKWCISHFKECFHVSKYNLEFKQYLNNKIIPWLEKQKPLEWSDKDEKMKESIIKALYGGGHFAYEPEITWLKSLRPQSKQMISEDTEVLMTKLINLLKSYRIGEETATTLANRIADTYGTQRYMDGLCDSGKLHWKPSEEQMNALYNVINPCDHVDKKALESLYEQLKKLI